MLSKKESAYVEDFSLAVTSIYSMFENDMEIISDREVKFSTDKFTLHLTDNVDGTVTVVVVNNAFVLYTATVPYSGLVAEYQNILNLEASGDLDSQDLFETIKERLEDEQTTWKPIIGDNEILLVGLRDNLGLTATLSRLEDSISVTVYDTEYASKTATKLISLDKDVKAIIAEIAAISSDIFDEE